MLEQFIEIPYHLVAIFTVCRGCRDLAVAHVQVFIDSRTKN
jgi:hypothetical protein